MEKYPIKLRKDGQTILVTFLDYPGATYGNDRSEARVRAVDALETLFIGYIASRQEIFRPSAVRRGQLWITLPVLSQAKVELYRAMCEAGVSKTELSRRLGCHMPQVDRLLDLRHESRLEQLEKAFVALNKRLAIKVSDAA
jgi:antitoxin HicB